ncbi:MAG TPA: EF-hand domain-containing protein [Rudaea sp.]|nr:EF-hand domain-containing protein [Rudaea sp.]
MKTIRFAKVALWIGAAFLLASGLASAQCTANVYNCCADGTPGTPCCGYGPCNIFCGNCDGGCRRQPDPLPSGWDPSCGHLTGGLDIGKAIKDDKGNAEQAKKIPEPLVGRALFDKIDTNHDGTISLAETEAWAKASKSTMTKAEIRAGFEKADANHDGKIQPSEFDRSLADTPENSAGKHR